MNKNISKFMLLMIIDVFLTAVDYIEAYEEGIVEDYYDEPYEFDEYEKTINFIITEN